MFWIKGLPIPPSANTLYETNVHKQWVKRNGKPFLKVSTSKRLSPELKTFQDRCLLFGRQYSQQIKQFSLLCHQWIAQGYVLQMDSYCVFHHDRVFTKDCSPQQIDADNYRKALQDAVFKLLGVDDKYCFRGNIEKVTCIDKDLECAIVQIKPVRARNLIQIRDLMGSSQPT